MLTKFKDSRDVVSHADFQRWRQANPEGYFANLKTRSEILIHEALCTHPGDAEWECGDDGYNSLTKKLKVCSNDLGSILNWAKENNISVIRRCTDCDPH